MGWFARIMLGSEECDIQIDFWSLHSTQRTLIEFMQNLDSFKNCSPYFILVNYHNLFTNYHLFHRPYKFLQYNLIYVFKLKTLTDNFLGMVRHFFLNVYDQKHFFANLIFGFVSFFELNVIFANCSRIFMSQI